MSERSEHMALIAGMREVVGAEHVLVDPDVKAAHETDWTRRYSGTAIAVVRPADAEQTAAVLARCAAAGAPVVPQGGNTGLVGASVPRQQPMVVVSSSRLTSVGDVDGSAGQISLGAGVTIAAWRAAARAAGFDAAVDFGARDSATVGGATATNAGGSRVVRFGTMRAQVMGVVAALGTGDVVGSLSGLPKETIGLHWPAVLCGSEGTLGIVTDVRLRLVPWYRQRVAALVGMTLDAAVELLDAARRALPHLDVAELLLDEAMDVATAHLGRPAPVEAADAYVLLECADHDDPTDDLTDFLASFGELGDTALATDDPGIARLVEPRDRMAEAIARCGIPLKLDVAVAPARLGELVALAQRAAEAHGCRFIGFGHLAEGNVHINLLGPANGDGTHAPVPADVAASLADEILAGTTALGGTISAEHGVGIAKARWLPLVRSVAELDAIAAIKRALDPDHILNPGVLEAGAAASADSVSSDERWP